VWNIGGNQFGCGQVSRRINVTDKPEEGVGWGGVVGEGGGVWRKCGLEAKIGQKKILLEKFAGV
jgi:hypothetical protein